MVRGVKIKHWICTLNFVLIVTGYGAFTTLFSSYMGIGANFNSQLVTIPYRILSLFLSILSIIVGKRNESYINKMQWLSIFVCGIAILRLIIDHYFDRYYISPSYLLMQYLFLIPITFIAIISIIKSTKYIDARLAVYLIWGLLTVSGIVMLSTGRGFINSEQINSRIEGNLALNSIATGHVGLSLLITATLIFVKKIKSLSFILKVILASSIIIAFIITLRAGSRGPILTLVIVAISYFLFYSKDPLKNIAITFLICLIIYLSMGYIESFISDFAPTLYKRIFERADQLSDRAPLYNKAFEIFFNSPLIGGSYAIMLNRGEGIYAHNYFMDAMMQAGIIGLIIVILFTVNVFKVEKYSIHYNLYTSILALLMIQNLCLNLTTGALYTNNTCLCLACYLSIYCKDYRKRRHLTIREQSLIKS